MLACPDAVTSTSTPSGPQLEIPVEMASLITRDTFILLNKTDLLPTSALAPAALASALPQHGWAVSLASHAGTDEFLAGLATALQERYGDPLVPTLRCLTCTCRYHLQDSVSEETRAPLITHARHRSHLESALGFLDAFLETRGALWFLNPFDLFSCLI